MPLGGGGAVPSQLAQQFFHGGGVNCLVLTKAIRPVVCVYYDLMDHAASKIIPKLIETPTPAMARLVVHSAANYAFILAVLYASSRYQLKYDIALCQDDSFHTIRAYVREELLRECLDVMPPLISTKIVNTLVRRLEFELNYEKKERWPAINSTLDTGELDGPKVQECWQLFKAALAQAGDGMRDLLPPLGYKKWKGGPEQDCLKQLFNQKCRSPHCLWLRVSGQVASKFLRKDATPERSFGAVARFLCFGLCM